LQLADLLVLRMLHPFRSNLPLPMVLVGRDYAFIGLGLKRLIFRG
jgi:hypothetical protein